MRQKTTKYMHMDNAPLSLEEYKKDVKIIEAARILSSGGTVAFPTETVYGLGANACDEAAVSKIFEAKGRPSDNPLIVHIGYIEQLYSIWPEASSTALKLIDAFWPGPLTLVVPYTGSGINIASNVRANLNSVAVRMPSNKIAHALLQVVKMPIAAPSANISGRPSPTDASHVLEDLDGRIDMILDGGATQLGIESTVLDIRDEIRLLRPGSITEKQLKKIIDYRGNSRETDKQRPVSPGTKYKHYSPKAKLYIIDEGENLVVQKIQEQIQKSQRVGKRVGVLTTSENEKKYEADVVVACGQKTEPSSVAKRLYSSLRFFDKMEVDIIFAENLVGITDSDLNASIIDRLYKAAEKK